MFATRILCSSALEELKKISLIKLPMVNAGVEYVWPNAWYIIPGGYLYNTGGIQGHKEGNLVYSFYHVIYEALKHNEMIPHVNFNNQIRDILKRGYVTNEEFQNYSHLIYKLPTIITPEVECDIERKRNIINMNREAFEKIVSSNNYPQLERSYQKNLITLVVGHLVAENVLFQSFARMNFSRKKADLVYKLYNMTSGYLPDILVRYSGFNKVESVLERTITTSSLKGIEEFAEYLDKGWNLHLISGIVYDVELDELVEVDFNSYYVRKYLDNELSKYKGKGKILIKDSLVK